MKNKNKIQFIFIITLLLATFIFAKKPALAFDINDLDGDGLSNYDEANVYHTNPINPDTDGDGYSDTVEIDNGYSPRHKEKVKLIDIDSDLDGLNDAWEIKIGTDLLDTDTDQDGYFDGIEVLTGYNPLSPVPQKAKKFIAVDLKNQKLAYYFENKKLDEFLISSGLWNSTPRGNFEVMDKVPSKSYGGQGYNFYYPNTKWNLHFTTGRLKYYIHGAYWHNKFGRPASHGCINVAYSNMERLYDWASVGTKVKIF